MYILASRSISFEVNIRGDERMLICAVAGLCSRSLREVSFGRCQSFEAGTPGKGCHGTLILIQGTCQ